MVVSSGLISLNIHDSLTFDGAEICLHPDLFMVASSTTTTTNITNNNHSTTTNLNHHHMNHHHANNNNNNTNSSSTNNNTSNTFSLLSSVNTTTMNSVLSGSDNQTGLGGGGGAISIIPSSSTSLTIPRPSALTFGNRASTGSTGVVANSNSSFLSPDRKHLLFGTPGGVSSGHAVSGTATTTTTFNNNMVVHSNTSSPSNSRMNQQNSQNKNQQVPLQVGDIIEIRVWDPIVRTNHEMPSKMPLSSNNNSRNTMSHNSHTTTTTMSNIIRPRPSVVPTNHFPPPPLPPPPITATTISSSKNIIPKTPSLGDLSASVVPGAFTSNRSSSFQELASSPSDSLIVLDLTTSGDKVNKKDGLVNKEASSLQPTSSLAATQSSSSATVLVPTMSNTTTSPLNSPHRNAFSAFDGGAIMNAKGLRSDGQTTTTPGTGSFFSDLPPVFPRNRTSTADMQVQQQVSPDPVGTNPGGRGITRRSNYNQQQAPPPPPPITSSSTIRSSDTLSSVNSNNTSLISHSSVTHAVKNTSIPIIKTNTTVTTTPTPVPLGLTTTGRLTRHSRDLSDITADTVVMAGTKLQLQQQQQQQGGLPIKTIPHPYANITASSTDDDDDDDDDDVETGVGNKDDGWSYLSATHNLRLSFIMLVSENSLTALKGPNRSQVSMLRQVADLYQLSAYDTITINKVEKNEEETVLEAVSADFVVVTIKDQFISRGDMHYFQSFLTGTWLYEGQRLLEPSRQYQAFAKSIRHQDQLTKSGIVTPTTTVTFRSRSARIIWLVQLSAEMWEYAPPYQTEKNHQKQNIESQCEIYFDKWITFLRELFMKWKELEATHSLTVVYFSRTYIKTTSVTQQYHRDVSGKYYEDHFRPVIENVTGPDWEKLVVTLKKAFIQYPSDVGWMFDETNGMEPPQPNHRTNTYINEIRTPSIASQGNVLEAINVTLNLLQYHYLDRDLHRTGNSIVVISAGSGVFEVDQGLAGVTYQRMMDNGIGSDMLSLGLPALHIAPFFLYKRFDSNDIDAIEQYYELPHWMHLSFVSYESDKTVFDTRQDIEVVKDERPVINQFAELEIRPNGFLIQNPIQPTVQDNSSLSPLMRPTSLPGRGNNNNVSPVKKQVKQVSSERQLIAGRDFRDILEACRPRVAGAIPSSLKAAIDAYHDVRCRKPTTDPSLLDPTNQAQSKDSMISNHAVSIDGTSIQFPRLDALLTGHESVSDKGAIGTIDVNVAIIQPGRSPRNDEPERIENDVNSSSSHSVSLESQASSSVLGASFDRPYLEFDPSFSNEGHQQLQRSESLKYDMIGDDDYDSDGVLSDGEGYGRTEPTNQFEDNLIRMMTEHDRSMAVLAPTKPRRNHGSRGETQVGTVIPQTMFRNQSHTTGGIGAALQQHRVSSGGTSISHSTGEPSTSHRIMNNDIGMLSGTPTFRHLNDRASVGMSPFGNPIIGSLPNDIPESLHLDRRVAERRFVHLKDRPLLTVSDSIRRLAKERSTTGSVPFDSRYSSKSQVGTLSLSVSPPQDQTRIIGSVRQLPENEKQRSQVVERRSRSQKAFNPFRQQDEEDVLAKKSHNRLRWSHVFPLGEVEFKRHAGPNWKSLCAPAILPLAIDYFPSKDEIRLHFTLSINNVTLSEFERKNYTSNKDLLMELVRQRITQDYQLVSKDNINANNYRPESLPNELTRRLRAAISGADTPDSVRHFLSMGHRLQVLAYDPALDVVEVTRYNLRNAQRHDASNTFHYQYLAYCQETRNYKKITQTFEKYSDQYNWNKVDRIICGDEDRELREGMRFRRVMFGIIPDKFLDERGEKEYVAKFNRLLEYFNKLREKDDTRKDFDITFVCKYDITEQAERRKVDSAPGIAHIAMQRFYIQLRRGNRDQMEWIEVVVDSTFNTTWSYRILFNWLVASSGKVDAQIQLLQRRCVQFGLNLVPFPQITVSRNVYLYPFKAPVIYKINTYNDKVGVDKLLEDLDFLYDGVFDTDVKSIIKCQKNWNDFVTPLRTVLGRQFVHRSGTLFVRIITDRNGVAVIVVLGNYRYLLQQAQHSKDGKGVEKIYRQAFHDLTHRIQTWNGQHDLSRQNKMNGL